MRNKFLTVIMIFTIIFTSFTIYAAPNSSTFHLVVLHSNDFHGADYAALARTVTLIKAIRAQEENVLYLNAGDLFTRGPYHRKFYGELEFAILNAVGCDALTLGNNEFKATGDPSALYYLTDRINQAQFPILCSNIVDKKSNRYIPKVLPFYIKSLHDLRIGIIGMTTSKVSDYSQADSLKVLDPIHTAEALFPKVSSQSDIVLALTHIGLGSDLILARRLPKLAAVIGGDSHTILSEPEVVNGIPIVQAGDQGAYLGRLDLFFEAIDGRWKLKEYKGQLIPITKSIMEDSEIDAIIQSFMKQLKKDAA